jgi:1-deoxy-D-xylulose-5-phosphate synthase
VDILAEPALGAGGAEKDVLLVAVGAFGAMAVEAARLLAAQGIGVTVVDPRWALPVPAEIDTLAAEHRLVVTVEDGGRSGGVGAAVADRLSGTGVGVHVLALPQRFLEPASRGELLAELGLTGQAVARGITELIARRSTEPARADEPAGQQ